MEPEVNHRQAVSHTFEELVDIKLDNLVVGIEELTVRVGTMEVHHIEFSQILVNLDNIGSADYNEVVICDYDPEHLLL